MCTIFVTMLNSTNSLLKLIKKINKSRNNRVHIINYNYMHSAKLYLIFLLTNNMRLTQKNLSRVHVWHTQLIIILRLFDIVHSTFPRIWTLLLKCCIMLLFLMSLYIIIVDW